MLALEGPSSSSPTELYEAPVRGKELGLDGGRTDGRDGRPHHFKLERTHALSLVSAKRLNPLYSTVARIPPHLPIEPPPRKQAPQQAPKGGKVSPQILALEHFTTGTGMFEAAWMRMSVMSGVTHRSCYTQERGALPAGSGRMGKRSTSLDIAGGVVALRTCSARSRPSHSPRACPVLCIMVFIHALSVKH